MDISAAYQTEELQSFKRSFSFTDSSVTMTDKIAYSGDDVITERFVTLDIDAIFFSITSRFIPRKTLFLFGAVNSTQKTHPKLL